MNLPISVFSLILAKTCNHARTVHNPSFYLTWNEPVPNDYSPQIEIRPSYIKFPKNFQPVGVSYNFTPNFSATLSTAPDVGILLATPRNFYFKNKLECAARIANESDGVTKKFLPNIIFRSASPSQAAPKSNYDCFSAKTPISFTRCSAHLRLGSG